MRRILFLCTGNSARSIMAEAYMNHVGAPHWLAFSAGSNPTGKPNPFALETLRRHGIPIREGENAPRSKSWDEFARKDAPAMDVIVTVCDKAAGEVCPVWPMRDGKAPKKLHWSFPDPAAATGADKQKRKTFQEVFAAIRSKVDEFSSTDSL